MMKKLLTLLLICGLASMASATLQISVNGDKEPVDSEIFLNPSEHLVLDIWTDAEIVAGEGLETYYALLVDVAKGTIDASGATSAYDDAYIEDDAISAGGVVMTDPPLPGAPGVSYNGGWGGVFTLGAPIPEGAVIIDLVDFHCNSAFDGTIYLVGIDGDTWALTEVFDSVVIHQPEPMTVALLGLGGLLLRRRK